MLRPAFRFGSIAVFLLAAGPAATATPGSEPGSSDARPWAYTAPPRRATARESGSLGGAESAAERKERLVSAQAHLDAANAAVREKDWNKAGAEIERVLALVPTRGDVIARAGTIFMMQGNYGLAANCWRELVDNFPDEASLRGELGAALLYMGRLDEADEEFGNALAQFPQEPSARFYRAALQIRRQHNAEAGATLGTLTLVDLWQALGKLIDEREPLLHLLGEPGFQALERLVLNNAALAQPDKAVARVHELLGNALEAMKRANWAGAAQSLRSAQAAGLHAASLIYDLAFCAYQLSPGPESLDKVERAVTQVQGGRALARAYVYLCLSATNYEAAARGVEWLDAQDDESQLLRAAVLAGRGHVDGAWTVLGGIPREHRARLAPWFERELPSTRILRTSPEFADWLPAQKAAPNP